MYLWWQWFMMVSVPRMVMTHNGKCTNDNERLIMVSIPMTIKTFDSKCTNDDKGL